jgi:hypothetical protein
MASSTFRHNSGRLPSIPKMLLDFAPPPNWSPHRKSDMGGENKTGGMDFKMVTRMTMDKTT